mgnify:CR=1 FL=1
MEENNWRLIFWQYFLMTVAVWISSVAVIIFLAPFDIAPSGISGAAVIFHRLFSTPIGFVTFLLNIPIQILAYRFLPGAWRVVVRTLYVLIVYSITMDWMAYYIPADGLSNNVLLNAIFGGVLEGVAGGLIFRAGGTFGGTSTLALILRHRFGMPMSTTLLYTDALVMAGAGFVFGWEAAMFAVVSLFISGVATDYVLEGPSVIRTAVIITNQPDEVSTVILHSLGRGVTGWEAMGMFTHQPRWILYVSISRSQVTELRRLVMKVDPKAFIVIGQGHTAYGEGFKQSEMLPMP